MLQPKPIVAALTNEHDKFYVIHRTNMKLGQSLLRKDVPQDKNLT